MKERLIKIGDALSQLINVAFLPRVSETTANESVSGRAYRQSWVKTVFFIDWLFSPWEDDHCQKSHEADLKRAKEFAKPKPRKRGA